MATNTPWGSSQQVIKVAIGIRDYSTASHGGFHLSPSKNSKIPAYMRNNDGWYEEDCAWCIPAMIFQTEFMSYLECDNIERIVQTFKEWYPQMFEQFFNTTLSRGESYMKDHPLNLLTV